MLGLIVVVVLMGGIICVALVQTRSAYTASFGSLLDASDLQTPGSGVLWSSLIISLGNPHRRSWMQPTLHCRWKPQCVLRVIAR